MSEAEHNNMTGNRREFIGNTFKLVLLSGLLTPLGQACNSKSKSKDKSNRKDTRTTNNKRSKWNQEKLIVNTKTNVVHLPTAVVYNYYDEIKQYREINANDWENVIGGEVRLNKEQSGNILEILSLQKLRNRVDDNSLSNATNTLSKAFSGSYQNSKGINSNSTNYRLHELMLQLVALNNSIPDENKWQAFNERVSKAQRIGKRQKWMETEDSFSQRVKYIQDRQDEYKTRLMKRVSKYSLT